MIFHLAITGEHEPSRELVRKAFKATGLAIGEEWTPVAEGTQRYPSRERVEDAGRFWAAKIANRAGQTGATKVWLPDYERLGDGADVRRDWMAGRIPLDKAMATYMGAARAAAAYLGTQEGGNIVPPDARLAWILLPQLIGTEGFDECALAFAESLLSVAQASFVCPSFRPRRLIGQGITAEAQRRRVRNGFASMAEHVGADRVVPELCPSFYGGTGSIFVVPPEDIHEQVVGLAEAGCREVVIWVQGEENACQITARHAATMAAAAAQAINRRPR